MKKLVNRLMRNVELVYISLTTKRLIIEISEPYPDGTDYYPYFWVK